MPATWSDGLPVEMGKTILTDEHGKKYEIDVEKHTFKEAASEPGDGCRDEAAKIVLVLLAGAAMLAALVGAVVKVIA